MLWSLWACQPVAESTQTHLWVEEVSEPIYFAGDLIHPVDFMVWEDGFLVADAGHEALMYVEGDEVSVYADDIVEPTALVSGTESYLFTAEEIYLIDTQGNVEIVLDERESPSAPVLFEEGLYWLEQGGLFQLKNGVAEELLSDLPDPYDLIVWEDLLWFTTQQDKAIWNYDRIQDPIQVHSFPEIPHRLAADIDQLWVSTRSSRWPYGGWIASFDEDNFDRQTQSPPEAEQIIAFDEGVIWASKQTIAYWTAEPYTSVALQVMVSSMHIVGEELFWSDRQGGRLGRINMGVFLD